MAKVTSPLYSVRASGKLANSIVYFPWKGLDCVRQWLIPANPRTTPQTTQRGYLADAVADIHQAMLHTTKPLAEPDKLAYAALASLFPTPRTWFNTICKIWLDQKRAGKSATTYRGGKLTPGNQQLAIEIYSDEIATNKITAGCFKYGTSKSLLLHAVTATISTTDNKASATISDLENGQTYFIQFQPTATESFIGAISGIYTGIPSAS
jgi:hypothetical protein